MNIKMIKKVTYLLFLSAILTAPAALADLSSSMTPSSYNSPSLVATTIADASASLYSSGARSQYLSSRQTVKNSPLDAGQIYENRVRQIERQPEILKNTNVEILNENVGAPTKSGQVVTDDVLLYIENVVFEGNSVISTKELQKLAQKNIIGRDITLAGLSKFVETITNDYQNKGYITSFAFLPPQTIKDRTLTVQIFEGRIGDISISGNKFSSTNFIKYQLLKPYFVEKNEILNVNDIRQAMIELNEKGFIAGSIVLQKGKEKGTTDLNLSVKDKQPFTLSIGWDNAGRELIGKHRFSAFLADNNLTGHGDVLSAGASFSERAFSVGPQYVLPVGNRGDKVYASYGYSYIKPGKEFKALNYRGKAHIITLGMTNPVFKNHNVSVDFNTNFNIKEGDVSILGYDYKPSSYSIRTLETGLQMVQKDKVGRTFVQANANIGLPILGSHEDSHFMTVKGGVVRQFWLPRKGVAMLRFNGQISPDSNVPAIEQYQVGGFQTVRGYDEGTLLGKSGFTASAQVNLPIPLPESVFKDRIQIVGFYDCGYAENKNIDLGTEFMQSAGTGLRFYLTKYLTASVDFGFPIGARPEGAHRFRTHFFLTSNIL